MKYSAVLSLAAAPLALAKAVHNVYPGRRDHPIAVKENQRTNSAGVSVNQAQAIANELLLAQALAANQVSKAEVIVIWFNNGGNAATTTVNQQVTVTQTVTAGAAGGAVKTGEAG